MKAKILLVDDDPDIREYLAALLEDNGYQAEAAPDAASALARASRVALMTDVLAEATPELLDERRPNPHAPERTETVRHCVQVVMEESWEHLRFAVRDLDALQGA